MIEPREYQIEGNNALFEYFRTKSGNPVVALPTGTGKSVSISMFLMSAFYQYSQQKMLVLTHVQELIEQNAKELLGMWTRAPVGINSSGLKRRDYNNNIIFGGIASVHKDWEKFGKIDIIIIDEAHLLSPNDETMYRKFIANLMTVNPYLKVIGFTATPYRLGQGLITDSGLFTDICFDLTTLEAFNKLIAQGYLSPLVPKKTNYELDITGVKLGQDGDFAKGQLQMAVDKYEITIEALKEARELGHDRNCWMIFASGIEHCEHISEILTDLEISNVVIHSKISSDERKNRFELFKSGQVKAIIGFRVLTTGFNHPPIDMIVDLYPTTSPSMHVQKAGRGTRPYDYTDPMQYRIGFDYVKKNCLYLDFSGNTARLGPINDPVMPKKKGEGKAGQAPVKLCDCCNTYNHASVRFCAYCNAEFVFKVKIQTEASTAQIIKDDLPIVESFKIDHIIYSKHDKRGGKPSLKVSYYSNLRVFSEYIGVEHTGFAKTKADNWWRLRAGTHSPDSILSAMYLTDQLKKPTEIKVWVNKTYPEIIDYIFDETAKEVKSETKEPILDSYDDSIPFNTTSISTFDESEFPF